MLSTLWLNSLSSLRMTSSSRFRSGSSIILKGDSGLFSVSCQMHSIMFIFFRVNFWHYVLSKHKFHIHYYINLPFISFLLFFLFVEGKEVLMFHNDFSRSGRRYRWASCQINVSLCPMFSQHSANAKFNVWSVCDSRDFCQSPFIWRM